MLGRRRGVPIVDPRRRRALLVQYLRAWSSPWAARCSLGGVVWNDDTSTLHAQILKRGVPAPRAAYGDADLRDFCTRLAEDMRDVVASNVYFDVRDGTLVVFV